MQFAPTGVLATNLTTAGRVSGPPTLIPDWPVGESRAFAIIGWPASYGTNFNLAWLQQGCVVRGVSAIGTMSGFNPFTVLQSGFEMGGPLSPELCPFINTQPQSQRAIRGATVSFSVEAASGPQPLTYQWQFNGADMPGATSSLLVLANVQPAQAGAYSVTVANGWSPVSSSLAYLTLTAPVSPTIEIPAASQTANAGVPVSFRVTAAGSPPLVYQWFFSGSPIASATASELRLQNVQLSDSGSYTVVVTNAYGSITSPPALLTVLPSPPTIVQPLQSQTANAGSTVTFSTVTVGSLPMLYQWWFNGTNVLAGATSPMLTLSNVLFTDSGLYSVAVSNAYGSTDSSLTLTVMDPFITEQPVSQPVAEGFKATFRVQAAGTQPLAFQWFKDGIALGDGGSVSGAQSDTLTISLTAAETAGAYWVVVSNRYSSVSSAHALLAILTGGTPVIWGGHVLPYVAPGTRFRAMAAGQGHTLATTTNGTILAWGANGSGQSDVPAGLRDVAAVAAGSAHSVALKSDGTVVAWGENRFSQTNVPPSLAGVVAISAGYEHCLALKSDGTVVAWGRNDLGQATVPSGLDGIVAISAGTFHNLALRGDGTVIAWGSNDRGQSTVPPDLNGVVAVAAGAGHSVALKSDHTVTVWGRNDVGQANVPPGLGGVTAIAAGEFHTVALRSDGTAVAWGYGSENQVPVGLADVVAIAAGGYHNLALKLDNSLATWGNNSDGQCFVPGNLRGIPKLSVSHEGHHLAIDPYGGVMAWGNNFYGENTVPTGLQGVISVAAGWYHSLGLQSEGTVMAWGAGGTGQSSDPNYGQSVVPAGLQNVIAVAAGSVDSLVLKADGTVVAWGSYHSSAGYLPMQVPPGLSNVKAIAAGWYHALAVKADGTVAQWGDTSIGQGAVPAGLSNVIAVAGGAYHSLALHSNGAVTAWGGNDLGQAQVPEGLDHVVAIAAGNFHNLALKPDGTVIPWGSDTWCKSLFNTAGLSNVLAIAAGGDECVALVADSPLVRFGPTSQTVEAGCTLSLYVRALGYPPLSYSWLLNGKNIANSASTPSLLITNVQPSNAGIYSVVISNALGTVISPPANVSVIPRVPRRTVVALKLFAPTATSLTLEFTDSQMAAPDWERLESVVMTNTSQWCFDGSAPLTPCRFYRAWAASLAVGTPSLGLNMVPAITLTGQVGSSVRVDYINQIGPSDAWVTLATVVLTNTAQEYFDTSAIGQPPRLYRLVTGP